MKSLEKTLEFFGFSKYYRDIIIYLSSQTQPKNAKEISEGSNVPLTRVYSILIGMEKRGIILSIPGKTQLYKLVDKEKLIGQLKIEKEKELVEHKQNIDNAISQLTQTLGKTIQDELVIIYFTKNDDYWNAYLNECKKMKSGDKYRLINSMRLCYSFLEEEIKTNNQLRSLINQSIQDDERGIKTHYVVNVDALMGRIRTDLKEEDKIKSSVQKMLKLFEKYNQNYSFTLTTELRNILIVIMSDSVFFEFYDKDSTKIKTAIQLKSKVISNDFKSWFNSICTVENTKNVEEFKKIIESKMDQTL